MDLLWHPETISGPSPPPSLHSKVQPRPKPKRPSGVIAELPRIIRIQLLKPVVRRERARGGVEVVRAERTARIRIDEEVRVVRDIDDVDPQLGVAPSVAAEADVLEHRRVE